MNWEAEAESWEAEADGWADKAAKAIAARNAAKWAARTAVKASWATTKDTVAAARKAGRVAAKAIEAAWDAE